MAFAAGIVFWFALPTPWHWTALITLLLGLAILTVMALPGQGRFPYIRQSLVILILAICAGLCTVWGKSEVAGTPAIDRPFVGSFEGKVISVEEQPALGRKRIVLETIVPPSVRPVRVRINLDNEKGGATPEAAQVVRIRARLMPPAPPMLPGGYDFARTAWFSGLAATGSALAPAEVLEDAERRPVLSSLRARLSQTAMERLPGSAGGIAAAFLTGDRGGIAETDAQAMRDAGLAHLLSISGLHVSAVIGAAYLISLRLLALWPWLVLRTRLPVVAAATGALAGIGYTLLTGSEVPTVRSCIAALLVLAAVALGREALSLRMLSLTALAIMAIWPEAVVGPSFQMSFGAVLAIVALSGAEPVRRWLSPREEGWIGRWGRRLGMLLLTGVVIEIVLMPIGFYHFHRAGVFGALANVLAIPLTTAIVMPSLALAVLMDSLGIGAPFWWIAGKSLDLLLSGAHWIAARPGAVTVLPSMSGGAFMLFVAGGLWLGLLKGRKRLLGLLPAFCGILVLFSLRAPDILISGDGHYVGIVDEGGAGMFVLRGEPDSFANETLREIAGLEGMTRPMELWQQAQCNGDFCRTILWRGSQQWQILIARSRESAPERDLAAACALSDIVIADRRLPNSCRPRWIKADRRLLGQTGGMTIDFEGQQIVTVAQTQGQHGWWRPDLPRTSTEAASALASPSAAPSRNQ